MLDRIRDGRTDLVFEYVAAGHAATAQDEAGNSLISLCAYHGDVSAIRMLVENGESLEALGDNFDLSGAAFHGHWQLCQFLIENGADVNHSLVDTGETPLHAALCKANRPIYEHVLAVLLAAGANPNVATQPDKATGAFMRDCRTASETPLHRAAAFGTEPSIEMLLEAGADATAKDQYGNSPLSWASWHLRPASILRLLCYGHHTIHPDNQSTYDHGVGWGQLDQPLRSRPDI